MQCQAMVSDRSRQCQRRAVDGMRVCLFHGGSVQTAKAANAKRMLQSAGPAIETLKDCMAPTMKDAPPCPLCGRGMPTDGHVRVKAATALLDRAGLGPQSKLEISTTNEYEWANYLEPGEAEQVGLIIERAQQRMIAAHAIPQLTEGDDDAIDAEVVGGEEATS